jgi:hypothetical protein
MPGTTLVRIPQGDTRHRKVKVPVMRVEICDPHETQPNKGRQQGRDSVGKPSEIFHIHPGQISRLSLHMMPTTLSAEYNPIGGTGTTWKWKKRESSALTGASSCLD